MPGLAQCHLSRRLLLLGGAALLLAIGLGCEPIGPIPGSALSGEPAEFPADWSFTDDVETIQIETRPSRPHSVTVWCATLDGRLYVPSRSPSRKRWVRYVGEDPSVRVRVGERLFTARAVRVTDDAEIEALVPHLLEKYDLQRPDPDTVQQVWFFRIDPPG